jgi:hypothetical protein
MSGARVVFTGSMPLAAYLKLVRDLAGEGW